ncbi:MAG: branched-chain amino acid aminotransferase [Propionibacteriaceae bacterium]|jgi:branched-chain amino acid aminotransferase|nr:branched-chain amino acid aminotransferase [Propionibacteriaceae bacterium]
MSLSFDLAPGTPSTPPAEIARLLYGDPGFGRLFSDHMAVAAWSDGRGWHDDRLQAHAPFQFAPGEAVLHYAQEIFEGLKAYRRDDDSIWLFRPEANARRFNQSADRLALPRLPEEDFLRAVRQVVTVDAAWAPAAAEQTLYLRPFMFASESFLGVRAAKEVVFAVIAGPAGSYFPRGPEPVDIWVTTTYSRSGAGGTGAAKCGGNYASSLLAERQAHDHDCQQVLFTDAASHEWVEELGGMNLCLVTAAGQLVTPPLDGAILAGVTRDSILQLAPRHGLEPVERPVSLTELWSGVKSGSIVEAFACGTAAVITAVRSFRQQFEDGIDEVRLPQANGRQTQALRRRLIDIQWGRSADDFGWTTRVV